MNTEKQLRNIIGRQNEEIQYLELKLHNLQRMELIDRVKFLIFGYDYTVKMLKKELFERIW